MFKAYVPILYHVVFYIFIPISYASYLCPTLADPEVGDRGSEPPKGLLVTLVRIPEKSQSY